MWRPDEKALIKFMMTKMEAIGRCTGGNAVWRAPLSPGMPGAHHEGNGCQLLKQHGRTELVYRPRCSHFRKSS
jgi:hypothetical protein